MFQNLQIRTKLITILTGPLLILTVLSAVGIGVNISESARASRVNELAGFAAKLIPLVHAVQLERGLSNGYVGSQYRTGEAELIEQRRVVDSRVAGVRRAASGLPVADFDQRLQDRLDAGLERLGTFAAQRQTIDNRSLNAPGQSQPKGGENAPSGEQRIDAVLTQALDGYTETIGSLLDINAAIASGSDNERLLGVVATLDAFSRAKESADQERAFMNRVFSLGRFGEGDYDRFVSMMSAQDFWSARFQAAASPRERELADASVVGPDVERSEQLRDIARTRATAGTLGISPSSWWTVMTGKVERMRQVETRLAEDVAASSTALQARADRRAFWLSVVLTAVLWGTVGLSLLAARVMVNPLVRLRDVANDVAHRRLPGLVERLHEGEPVDLQREVRTIGIRSKDEIGQVAEAFNSVHRVAVTIAGEQAGLRKSIGDMFLNLARRNQVLTERQLEKIDELERGETDPDALEDLYQLDHLATRMRRNAENLIVLSGSEAVRRWQAPVPLNDAVRAAIGEVEDYTRVELFPTPDVGVSGQVAGDVMHLLAELIENATSFSPPETKVRITGLPIIAGHVVEIEDKGIGMTDAELFEVNERLANPPVMDFALSKTLGFNVVGRLAIRHGIKVQLRHSWYGGVTALVLIPEKLLVKQVDGRAPGVEGGGGGYPNWPSTSRAAQVQQVQPALTAPESAGGGGAERARLPIFESTRSDWFHPGPSAEAAQWEAEQAADRASTMAPAPPLRAPAAPKPAPRAESAEAPRPPDPTAYSDYSDDDEEPPTTSVGLPRRVPAKGIASGLTHGLAAPKGHLEEPELGDSTRSPAEVRDLLSTYRRGLTRGRTAATDAMDRIWADDDDLPPDGSHDAPRR